MSQPGQVDTSTTETLVAPSGTSDVKIVEDSLLSNHIQETAPSQENTTLELFGLEKVEDITQRYPNFPQSMPHLQSLELSRSISPSAKRWDPSNDPFKSFPSTLERLFLGRIPIYPSFCDLTTLTKFTFHDFAFAQPLDTLLGMLENNSSLKDADLQICFEHPGLRLSRRKSAIGIKLQLLKVYSPEVDDIKALISGVPLARGGQLQIFCDKKADIEGALSHIANGACFRNLRFPTGMTFLHGQNFDLFGPGGSFGLDQPRDGFPLKPESPTLSFGIIEALPGFRRLCEGVKTLQLMMKLAEGVFSPSLFPALGWLIIKNDQNLSNTLSLLFAHPESSPELHTLILWKCGFSGGFMAELTKFISYRKEKIGIPLKRLAIIHREEESPSAGLIPKLEDYVSDVWVDRELPSYCTRK